MIRSTFSPIVIISGEIIFFRKLAFKLAIRCVLYTNSVFVHEPPFFLAEKQNNAKTGCYYFENCVTSGVRDVIHGAWHAYQQCFDNSTFSIK